MRDASQRDSTRVAIDGQRVCVTGGGGFIGSHLVEQLVGRGCRVRALVRYNSRSDWGYLEELSPDARRSVEVVLGDVRDARSVSSLVAGCSAAFHLAALIGIPYSYRAPQSYVDTNITGTLNMLEACRAHGVDVMVHTSTSEVYGTALYTPIDEKHDLQGQSPYAASKIAADKLAESYYRSFDVPVTTIRPFNTFGPRQSARAIIPTILSQALSGLTIELGSLDPVRDLTYVEDTACGFIAGAEHRAAIGRTINLGVGAGITIGDLARRILRILGKERTCRIVTAEQRVRPPKSEVLCLISDNTLARELLDWRPQVDLDTGLKRTAEYVLGHLSAFKVDRYVV